MTRNVGVTIAALVCVLLAPVILAAKGTTTLIELRSRALAEPIRITDAKVREFDVWSGPGVNGVAVADAVGFIADWKAGTVAAPPDLQRYDVLFYTASCASPGPGCDDHLLSYVVTYGIDPATRQGYVYFPGETETLYAINGPSIYRGRDVEGRWFRTTTTWDAFATPLIASAAR
jgi:hypothetical protein